MSELVKMMIDDDQDDEESQEIPLPNVKSAILAKVIEYCQHYKTEPMTEIEKVCLSIHTNVTIKPSLMLE
jgi:S-phase kinase-associated protein 1